MSKRKNGTSLYRVIKKHVLGQGVKVQKIERPVKVFTRLVHLFVAPMLSYPIVSEIVNKAIIENGTTYNSEGITMFTILDSNMPDVFKTDINSFMSSIYSGIIENTTLSEKQEEQVLFHLPNLIVEVTEELTEIPCLIG